MNTQDLVRRLADSHKVAESEKKEDEEGKRDELDDQASQGDLAVSIIERKSRQLGRLTFSPVAARDCSAAMPLPPSWTRKVMTSEVRKIRPIHAGRRYRQSLVSSQEAM